MATIYSGGGNGVDSACDAWARQCGDSVYGTCENLHVYVRNVYDVF